MAFMSSPALRRRADEARLRASVAVARGVGLASKAAGRGSGVSIRGKVIERLAPSALHQLLNGRRSLLVTGTNGKTTTTHFLTAAMGGPERVVTNADGANLRYGIVSALATAPRERCAVLETDERVVAPVLHEGSTDVLVILNLSRDQMDRHHELPSMAKSWIAALEELGDDAPLVVATVDDPLVVWAAQAAPRQIWVDANSTWSEDAALCPRCGAVLERGPKRWSCTGCALERPRPDWTIEDQVAIGPDGQRYPLQLQVPGAHNVGNAVCALAAAASQGVDPAVAARRLESVTTPAGRYATVSFGDERSRLLLAKNPAGWATSLPLAQAPTIVLAVDSQYADGRDVSWLYDVDFEALAARDARIIATGYRWADLSTRLSYAGVQHRAEPDLARAVRGNTGEVDIVATYTAFQILRKLGGLA